MSSTQQLTHLLDTQLFEAPQYYKHADRVREDCVQLFSRCTTLTPQKRFFPRDRLQIKLLVLVGTIPINYKDATYNIPLEIVLLESYPVIAPVVTVVPTPNMLIVTPHECVDPSGRCILPYLTSWAPQNTLFNLIGILQQKFSHVPPVRSRPGPPPPYTTSQSTVSPPSYDGIPRPFVPPNYTLSTPSTTSYPTATYPPSTAYSTNYPTNIYNGPPKPASTPSSNTPYYSGNLSYSYGPTPTPPYNPSQSFYSTPTQPVTYEDPSKVARRTAEDLLREKASKLIMQKKEEIERSIGEADTLQNENEKLSATQNKLLDEKRKLAEEEAQYERQLDDLTKWLEANDKQENQINIDQLTEPEDDIMAQLLYLQAEDLAIEDTQYYLDKALQKGTIDLNSYLKATRSLSEDQFYNRALVNKINSVTQGKTLPESNLPYSTRFS